MLHYFLLDLSLLAVCVCANGYTHDKLSDTIEELVANAVKKVMMPDKLKQMEQNIAALQRKVKIQEARIEYLESTKLDYEALLKKLFNELEKPNRQIKATDNVTQNTYIQEQTKFYSSVVKDVSDNNKPNVSINGKADKSKLFIKRVAKSNHRGRRGNGEIVAFSTYLGQYIERLGPGYIVKCNNVILNKGDAYNTKTGVFTAPYDGVYQFDYHFDSSRHTVLALFIDGVNQLDAVTFPTAHQEAMGGNLILAELKAGQQVWLEGRIIADGIVIGDDSFRYTTFSGVMLYRIQNDI